MRGVRHDNVALTVDVRRGYLVAWDGFSHHLSHCVFSHQGRAMGFALVKLLAMFRAGGVSEQK